jgi:hypothetical protein
MTLTILDCEQRSEAWFEARRGIVTASTVKGLLTPTLKVADNDTSRAVVRALVAERLTGETEESFMSSDMWRGLLHEPFARQRYAEHNGVDVTEVGFAVRTFDNGHRLGASPDGLAGDDGGIEVKCPRAKTHIQTVVADEVPAGYMAQVQASLLVFDRQWWDYVSFFAGQPMFIKRVYPDARWQAAIREAVASFEQAAAELTSDYLTRCKGLPTTEPIPDLDELVI